MSRKILVVEDNQDLAQLLAMHLRDTGYAVETVAEGNLALAKARGAFDLVILDLMLPGMDGIEICRRLRAESIFVPILMLTSKSSELDRVLGLEMGADDYLTKPFSIQELLARVKAIFRRIDNVSRATPAETEQRLYAGDISIDLGRRTVTRGDAPIDLTAREFDLLVFFAQHPGRVYTRTQLLDHVWGYGHDGYEHTVNSHINRLRAKIETDAAQPGYILTVWGVGYKFMEK